MPLTPETEQLTLDFQPGLCQIHRNLRDCVATSIYRRGLSSVAIDLNESPGNLGNQLSDESQRKFGIDDLELYLEKSRDFTPIYYLIDKFLRDESSKQGAAMAQLAPLLKQLANLAPLMKQAGLS